MRRPPIQKPFVLPSPDSLSAGFSWAVTDLHGVEDRIWDLISSYADLEAVLLFSLLILPTSGDTFTF